MLTPSASASEGRWSSASRRCPDSSRLSVETSRWARAATCRKVSPLASRSSRKRRRTRSSVLSLGADAFGGRVAMLATEFATPVTLRTVRIMNERWECIIVGGGAAGLSAALVLGRARKRTLLVDAGAQSNRPAHGIGGLLGHDGRPPAELYASGRRELVAYPSVEVRDGAVTVASSTEGGFTVTLTDGSVELTQRLILATGMDYQIPELPGLAERWGRSVFHCPFCHGWEVRDRPLCVLDSDAVTGVHRALLLTGWSADVTLLTNGPAGLTDEDRDHLVAAGVDCRRTARRRSARPGRRALDDPVRRRHRATLRWLARGRRAAPALRPGRPARSATCGAEPDRRRRRRNRPDG